MLYVIILTQGDKMNFQNMLDIQREQLKRDRVIEAKYGIKSDLIMRLEAIARSAK